MSNRPRQLLHLLRSRRGSDDLLRELLRAQGTGESVGRIGETTVRVRPLGKTAAPPHEGQEATR